jgi:hypothetical protein
VINIEMTLKHAISIYCCYYFHHHYHNIVCALRQIVQYWGNQIKEDDMGGGGHVAVASMGEMRNKRRILVGNLKRRKRSLGRTRCRWEANIKVGPK